VIAIGAVYGGDGDDPDPEADSDFDLDSWTEKMRSPSQTFPATPSVNSGLSVVRSIGGTAASRAVPRQVGDSEVGEEAEQRELRPVGVGIGKAKDLDSFVICQN